VPDPETAPIITQLYEWFSTGHYSLKALAAKARDAGFRLGKGKLHKSEIHQILHKRIYNGDFDFDGKTYRGGQLPLVTNRTWERVEELLDAKTRPRKQKHDFPYTGLITCGHCGCQLVAEIKKERYVYYHCTNGKGTNCQEPYTRQERLANELTAVPSELVIPKPITDWLRAALRQNDTNQSKTRNDALDHATAEYARIEARIEAMYLDKLDARITAAFFDEKASAWRAEQAKLQHRIRELQEQTANYEDAITNIEVTSKLCREFPNQPPNEQRRLLTIVIKTATWKEGKFEATLKNPFQKLRVSNAATNSNEKGKGEPGEKMKNWLPK
jgi:site-specific DNA recombinase